MDELFWALLIVVCAIAPLLVAAFVVEAVAPKARSWIERTRKIAAERKTSIPYLRGSATFVRTKETLSH